MDRWIYYCLCENMFQPSSQDAWVFKIDGGGKVHRSFTKNGTVNWLFWASTVYAAIVYAVWRTTHSSKLVAEKPYLYLEDGANGAWSVSKSGFGFSTYATFVFHFDRVVSASFRPSDGSMPREGVFFFSLSVVTLAHSLSGYLPLNPTSCCRTLTLDRCFIWSIEHFVISGTLDL